MREAFAPELTLNPDVITGTGLVAYLCLFSRGDWASFGVMAPRRASELQLILSESKRRNIALVLKTRGGSVCWPFTR